MPNSRLLVVKLKWGEVTLSNGQRFRDVILTPNSAKSWNWNLDGTRHDPGVTCTAVEQLIDCDKIIISQGMNQVLKTKSATIQYLIDTSKKYDICQSELAVERYNKAVLAGENVGLLLHSTC